MSVNPIDSCHFFSDCSLNILEISFLNSVRFFESRNDVPSRINGVLSLNSQSRDAMDAFVVHLLEANPERQNEFTSNMQAILGKGRRLGVDVRALASDLAAMAARSDELKFELIACRQGFLLKVILTVFLCLAIRLALVPSSLGLPIHGVDAFFMVAGVVVSGVLVVAFFRILPTPWTMDQTTNQVAVFKPSSDFERWFELLFLDERIFSSEVSPAAHTKGRDGLLWPEILADLKALHGLEFKDGINRRGMRRSYLLRCGQRNLQEAQRKIHRIQTFLPLTELLLTICLGVGICGFPAVHFLESDAKLEETLTGDFSDDIQEGDAFGGAADQSIDHR